MTTKSKPAAGAGSLPSPFKSILPESLKVGRDKLLLRLDFYSEAIVMHLTDKKGDGAFRMVSAHDLAHALAAELSFTSGLLPPDALWWSNTRSGLVVGIYIEAGIRRLALQEDIDSPPERYNVPLPGLIFICRPGQPPHVYATTKRPEGPKAKIYKAPMANVYDDGRSCAGTHTYPADTGAIPDSFLRSFFSEGANVNRRSKKFPNNICDLWRFLDGKDKFPLDDMYYHGTLKDLMEMRI